MDVFVLLLLFIIFFSTKFYKKDFNDNFLDYSQTLCINGIFVILVFLRHSTDYCDFSQSSSYLFNFVKDYIVSAKALIELKNYLG